MINFSTLNKSHNRYHVNKILSVRHLSDVAAVFRSLENVAEHVGPRSVAGSRIHLVGIDLQTIRTR